MKNVTNSDQISHLVINNYKSIKACDVYLGRLNVLIGSNGAGKSNFISFFKLLQQMLAQSLQLHVSKSGGPDALLHYGRKHSEKISAELYFGNNGYKFSLSPTLDNRMVFEHEAFWWNQYGDKNLGSGHFESYAERGTRTGIDKYVLPQMKSWRVYHFHDTSDTAKVKQMTTVSDQLFLRNDAANLAAFLYRLKGNYQNEYQQIVSTIQLVAPYFQDFHLQPQEQNRDSIELLWFEKGSDVPFKASYFSDGTLRFICLATVLLQPEQFKPATIMIDEPELGLHPYAISVLASLMKSASETHQLIVSTQSVELVNEFDAEDLLVIDKLRGETLMSRPDEQELSEWINDYALGELWKKNLLGGRPGY